MEKSVAGLLAVASVFALPAGAANAAQASAAQGSRAETMEAAMHASNYSDLLKPIPNARELLASEAAPGESTAGVEQVQLRFYIGPPRRDDYYYHHHHHHHHNWYRRYHHHHHHWYHHHHHHS